MSSKVYYRYTHELGTDARVGEVTFYGPSIRLGELKRELIAKLGMSATGTSFAGFDLDIRDTEKQDSYQDSESTVVPRNSTVLVSRVPLRSRHHHARGNQAPTSAEESTSSTAEEGARNNDFGDVFAQQQEERRDDDDELDMIRLIAADAQRLSGVKNQHLIRKVGGNIGGSALGVVPPATQQQSGLYTGNVADFDRTRLIGGRGGGRGNVMRGSGANFAAAAAAKPKKLTYTGIPKQFLTEVDERNSETGGGVALKGDEDAYRDKVQAIAATMREEDVRAQLTSALVPQDVQCRLHPGTLLKDAVRTKCCRATCSLAEISEALLKANFTCPLCGAHQSKIDDLEPDYDARARVQAFLETEKQRLMQSQANAQQAGAQQQQHFPVREVEELVLPSNNNYDVVLDLRPQTTTASSSSPVVNPSLAAAPPLQQQAVVASAPVEERPPWAAPAPIVATAAAAAPQQQHAWMAPAPRYYPAGAPATGEMADVMAIAAGSGACFSWTQTGTCRFGNICRFTHGGVPAKDVDMSGHSRGPCYAFERGYCKFGEGCRYDHAFKETAAQAVPAAPAPVVVEQPSPAAVAAPPPPERKSRHRSPPPPSRRTTSSRGSGGGGGGRNRSAERRRGASARGRSRSPTAPAPVPAPTTTAPAARGRSRSPITIAPQATASAPTTAEGSSSRRQSSPDRHHGGRGGSGGHQRGGNRGGRRRSRERRRR